MQNSGLLAVFSASRESLLRYFHAHGAGEAAEDCLQELWLRVSSSTPTGPIASPTSYLFRAATNVIIDRRRSDTQARKRDHEWAELSDRRASHAAADPAPNPEASLMSRQNLALVEQRLESLPARARAIFRRHRLDGLTQREVADEMGLSTSTVESDLRQAYRLLIEVRGLIDEE